MHRIDRRTARRGLAAWLIAAAFALPALSGCARPSAPFSATFVLPQGREVVLDYWGARDFRFSSPRGGAETWVVDGRIHLVVAPSLAFAGRGRVFLVGELTERPEAPPPPRADAWQPGATPGLETLGFDDDALRAVRVAQGPVPGRSMLLFVAAEPRLAEAQFVIDQTLRPAMDMALCGDAVNALVAAWPPALTGGGWAAVATVDGPRIEGGLRAASPRPELPADYDFEDLRATAP